MYKFQDQNAHLITHKKSKDRLSAFGDLMSWSALFILSQGLHAIENLNYYLFSDFGNGLRLEN